MEKASASFDAMCFKLAVEKALTSFDARTMDSVLREKGVLQWFRVVVYVRKNFVMSLEKTKAPSKQRPHIFSNLKPQPQTLNPAS